MHLTSLEQRVVALLRRDPLMTAATIADELGTTRSAVSVHLSNLSRKGVILGRGYLLSEQPGVVVIGGSNVDIKARSAAPATPRTSNPGHGSMTPGGVGRNIAENLARLGTRTHLVSAVGRDALGDNLVAQTSAAGVRGEHVPRFDGTDQFLGGIAPPDNFPQIAAATALVAGILSIAMGVVARFPLALAAGLGLNAFVAFSVASIEGMTWADAMGIVVLEGLIILLLVLTGFREAVFKAVAKGDSAGARRAMESVPQALTTRAT